MKWFRLSHSLQAVILLNTFQIRTILLLVLAAGLFAFAGCSSAPPPAPVPLARQKAQFSSETAQKLSQNKNWIAAEREWKNAENLWSLLYDTTNQAVALHNLAQTHRALDHPESAKSLLEKAALLNQEIKQTNTWWKNQLAIAQVEREQQWTEAYLDRLTVLSKLPKPDATLVLGLYFNEQALANQQLTNFSVSQGFYNQAETIFLKEKYLEGLVAVWANRALLFHAQTNHLQSLNAWRKSLDFAQNLGDTHRIAQALSGIAQSYIALNLNMTEAEKLLKTSAQNYGYLREYNKQISVLMLLYQTKQSQNQNVIETQNLLAKAHEEFASSLERGAKLDLARGHYESAAQLWSILNQPQNTQKAQEGVRRCTRKP